jgi:enoyl-CoA hydratase/carnithine racemase
MDYQTIILKKKDRIATITMNRPDRRNAFNMQLMYDLWSALEDVAQDNEIRVLILTGAGSAFCSGADFRYREVREGKIPLEEAEEIRPIITELKAGRLLNRVGQIILAFQRLDKPTIAMVHGDAVGLGFDLALACDMRIGSPKARFSVGFTRLGLPPDTGSAWFLPRIVGVPKALELILTGDLIKADEAASLGILNHLVTEEELEFDTMELARKLAKGPPIAHRLDKVLVYKGLEMDLESSLAMSFSAIAISLYTEDHKEGVRAFLERREPVFQGK